MKAVLFDFDGTIANTFPIIFESIRMVLTEFQEHEPSDQDVFAMFGPTELDIIKEQFPDREDMDPLYERFNVLYRQMHPKLVPEVPHIAAMLQRLQDRGLKLGIFTGKGRGTLDVSLELLFPDIHFDVEITGDDIQRAKPAPEGVLMALEEFNIGPDECLFVGDADADVLSGQAAGVHTVQACWFELGVAHPGEIQAEQRFENIADFENYVLQKVPSIG